MICTVLLSLMMFAASTHAVETSMSGDRTSEQIEAEQNKPVAVFVELNTPSAAKYHQKMGVMPSKYALDPNRDGRLEDKVDVIDILVL